MERIEAKAFKSSCMFSEEAMVNAQPLLSSASARASDDFSVDQFFDLDGLSEQTEDEEEEEEDKTSSSFSSISHDQIDEGSFSDANVLAIPADDIKELELWSHLMDGTLHDDIFRNPYIIPGPNRVQFQPKTRPVLIDATRFPPPVQTKPRTKRPRSITISWSSCSLLKPDYSFSTTGPGLTKNGLKRMKGGDLEGGPAQQMKCRHCQVQKTPQWRTGPLGPKTLCNACGVRFKSGRLFPEYRPACSPTFSSEVHSNSHRKVVEMRKKKISEHTSSNFAPTLLSC